MKTHSFPSVIAGAAILLSAVAFAQVGQPPAVPRFEGGAAATIPGMELFEDIIYLPAKVNGAGPYTFVLDTGAGQFSAIDYSVAGELGLEQTFIFKGGGAGEEAVDINSVDSVSLALAGLSFDPRSVMSIPLHRMDPHWGKRKDGLIGGDLLSTLVTVIDYERGTLSFHDPAVWSYEGPGAVVPVQVMDNFLFVEAQVLPYGAGDPVEALLLLDTGVRTSLFNTPFSREHALAEQSPSTMTGVTGFGLGGLSRGSIGRVRGIRIGETLIEEPVVSFSADTTGVLASPAFSGIIGADILSRFTVTLDYGRSRIVLDKNERFGEPFEYDMCGIRFVMGGERFDTFTVFSIFDGSPAAEAGIREGDVVTTVDGRPAGTFTRETLGAYLRREGVVVRFTISRGGTSRVIDVTLRRMI